MSLRTADSADLERLRAIVGLRLGLQFDDARTGVLDETLRARVGATGRTVDGYLDALSSGGFPREELRALAEALTVTETYFFRNAEQLDAFAEVALADRTAARGPGGQVSVLSVGCASGEEPYSLAMMVRETAPERSSTVSIRAVDVNPAALARARAANYSNWALRSTSTERRSRWFRTNGTRFDLDPTVRSAVRFQEGNLALDDPDLWRPHSYDIVFCRNVLMYFGADAARDAVARIERSLVPGGFLFLGHAETLRGLSNAFHLCHTHDTFYYRQKQGSPPAEARFETRAAIDWNVTPAMPDTSWVETIRLASERIDALAHAGSTSTRGTPALDRATSEPERRKTARAAPDLAKALDLIQREQFGEALHSLDALPLEHARDADVLLLRAVSLVHGGELAEGEAVCRLLLEREELNAGARYLLGLCREGAGDLPAARDNAESAIYLDSTFAMARLHLGLLNRRQGAHDAARRELSAALTLLEREDPSRLLLFGGGFGRAALIALCRAAGATGSSSA